MDKARILIYGDLHLSSKNYGAHIDYPRESLHYFKEIANVAEREGATHVIGLGDFTFGRFHTLEYRISVEKVLDRLWKITEGRHYMLKGNHDSATYGMTEYEYYCKKGLLKPSENLSIGGINISMVDNGKYEKMDIIPPEEGKTNVVLAHDYFKFKDTKLPNYGQAIELDEFSRWFGVDLLVCGHIHNFESFSGMVVDGYRARKMTVIYLGCMARPAYREGFMQDIGKLLMLDVDGEKVEAGIIDVPLWALDESFNLEAKAREDEQSKSLVDISDIVKRLDEHERNIGNPEDLIMSLEDIDIRYRKKAVELLQEALK